MVVYCMSCDVTQVSQALPNMTESIYKVILRSNQPQRQEPQFMVSYTIRSSVTSKDSINVTLFQTSTTSHVIYTYSAFRVANNLPNTSDLYFWTWRNIGISPKCLIAPALDLAKVVSFELRYSPSNHQQLFVLFHVYVCIQ